MASYSRQTTGQDSPINLVRSLSLAQGQCVHLLVRRVGVSTATSSDAEIRPPRPCVASYVYRETNGRGLPDLRWLDLDGNPCSQSRGYRHRVLRCCPRLLELDGEEIGQLDRDLSSLFFEEEVRQHYSYCHGQ